MPIVKSTFDPGRGGTIGGGGGSHNSGGGGEHGGGGKGRNTIEPPKETQKTKEEKK